MKTNKFFRTVGKSLFFAKRFKYSCTAVQINPPPKTKSILPLVYAQKSMHKFSREVLPLNVSLDTQSLLGGRQSPCIWIEWKVPPQSSSEQKHISGALRHSLEEPFFSHGLYMKLLEANLLTRTMFSFTVKYQEEWILPCCLPHSYHWPSQCCKLCENCENCI